MQILTTRYIRQGKYCISILKLIIGSSKVFRLGVTVRQSRLYQQQYPSFSFPLIDLIFRPTHVSNQSIHYGEWQILPTHCTGWLNREDPLSQTNYIILPFITGVGRLVRLPDLQTIC